MKDHILLWLVIFGICAIPGAALGFISWWWVVGPFGVFVVDSLIDGWRWNAARERAIRRARGEST